jgi:di/tricarboxylate transporter
VWFRVKARAIWLFGAALVLAGVCLALHGLGLFVWQYVTRLQSGEWVRLPASLAFSAHAKLRGPEVDPVLGFIPQSGLVLHEVALWLLDRVHIGLVSLLLGLLGAAAGVLLAMRQRALLDGARRLEQDRLRRLQAYRRH